MATVFGGNAVDPLTAPASVLAVLPGIDDGKIARLLELRDSQPIDQRQIENILGSAVSYTEIASNSAIRVELAAELQDGYASRATAVIRMSRTDEHPYRVLAWASHMIFQR